MQKTTNYEMNLPEGTDNYNVDDYNENFNIIDGALHELEENKTDVATTKYINGYMFEPSDRTAKINNFAKCTTDGATAEKAITVSAFRTSRNKPELGVGVKVQFTNDNTADNPTLNANDTTALPIYYKGANISATLLKANMIYDFISDGTHWILCGNWD